MIATVRSPLPFLRAPLGNEPGRFPADHAFCTRRGGVSQGPYEELNVSPSVGDDPHAVDENWRRVRAAFPHVRHWVTMRQVHGTEVHVVRKPTESRSESCDALVTCVPGVALCVTTADCVPILLSDSTGSVVAAVHAGWRGSVANVVGRVVERMAEEFSLLPAEVYAVLGPAIRPCCYVVGPEVAAAVDRLGLGAAILRGKRGGEVRLDLHMLNRELLHRADLRPERVVAIELCTACQSQDFFSHRRSGFPAGRQLSWVAARAMPGLAT